VEHAFLFTLAIVASFSMSWAIGANDVANAMGTSVGSRSITIRQAILIAAIFEALGAFSASGQVTETLRQGIVNVEIFQDRPMVLVIGMLSALFASATWLIIATYRGWPVSTTHTVVGAIIGFALLTVKLSQINWFVILRIASSWVFTPLLAAFAAYMLFRSVYRYVLAAVEPRLAARKWLPVYVFSAVFVTMLVTIFQGLEPLGYRVEIMPTLIFSTVVSLSLSILFRQLLEQNYLEENTDDLFDFAFVESSFGVLTVFTACAMAFAHGSNDIANAIGPLVAIVDILVDHRISIDSAPIPIWIVGLGSAGVVSGLAMYGYRIMDTVGVKITPLTPSRSFSAQLSTALIVILASGVGLPVSTTQTLVGAVLGVGFARGIGALNLNVVKSIFVSWLVTLPCGAILAIFYFQLISGMVLWLGL
tara:strand:+ start:1812 stop:3074 length:1263 start_codon:yes stop_codon:yes gene_type:complete